MKSLTAFLVLHTQPSVGNGLIPMHDGRTVRDMEGDWPGIMVLIQYRMPP